MKNIIEKIQNKVLNMDMSNFSWGEGVALWGFNHSLSCVENDKYLPYLEKWVETGIKQKAFRPTVNTSIPCVGIGEMYKKTKKKEYLDIIVNQAEFLINEAPKLKNGAIIHSDANAGLFGKQLWADTVFMAGLFLSYVGDVTDNKKYIDEAMYQLKIHAKMLQDDDGLFYHAWDEDKNECIGCKWGRANAWIAVGIVEMLDFLPVNDELVKALVKQLDGISKYQSESGFWRTVLDGTFSYYEASSAYGFGYAILKGIRLGIIDKKYLNIVDKMKDALVSNITEDGSVLNVSDGTPVMRNEGEYNIICPHRIQNYGQGLALMYFSEIYKKQIVE